MEIFLYFMVSSFYGHGRARIWELQKKIWSSCGSASDSERPVIFVERKYENAHRCARLRELHRPDVARRGECKVTPGRRAAWGYTRAVHL